jgi:S1-C subfamily serine protease
MQTTMIIQGIEDEKITDINGLQKALLHYAGQKVSVKIVSGYENKTFQVQLP